MHHSIAMLPRRGVLSIVLAAPALIASRSRAARPLRVSFVNPGRTDETFWRMAEAVMQPAALQLGIELEILHGNRSRQRIRELTLGVIARETRPDAVIIGNEEQTARDLLPAADRRGLPTMLVVTDLSPAEAEEIGAPRTRLPNFLGSVTPDNVAAGRVLAEATLDAAAALPGRPATEPLHLLAIAGDQITNSSVARLYGLQAALRARPGVVLDRTVFASWSAAEARTLAGRHLDWARRAGRLPGGAWAASDAMALAAMGAFEAAGLEPGRDAAFGGVNWSPEAIEAVMARRMAVTVGGHFFCAAWSLVALRDHADGHGFDMDGSARLRIPLSPIDRHAAPRYLETLGAAEWGRVDFRRFTRGARGGAAPYDFSLEAVLDATVG